MQKINDSRKKIINIFGGLFAITWGGFWAYCFYTAPRIPSEGVGRIYDVNFHGTSIYLTRWEYLTLLAIPIFFICIGILSAVYLRIRRD